MSSKNIVQIVGTLLGRIETTNHLTTSADAAFELAERIEKLLENYMVYIRVSVYRNHSGTDKSVPYYAILCGGFDDRNVHVDMIRALVENFLPNEPDSTYELVNRILFAKQIPFSFVKMPNGHHVWTSTAKAGTVN